MPNLITIATFQSTLEADAARRKLELEGVQTFLADEHIVSIMWIYSNAVGGVRLQVSSDYEQKAREILSRPEEKIDVEHKSDAAGGVVCPNCQSDNVRKERYARGVAGISWLFLGFPLPFPSLRYKCFYCDHEWNEKRQISASAKKRFNVAMLLLAGTVVVIVFFKFIYRPPAGAVRSLPESAYSWNAELNEKDGDLVYLLENLQAGSLLGYKLYRGENILQSINGWDTDLYDMMTRQEEDNVFREVFAGLHPVPESDLHGSPILIHIAIVRDLPSLPLNVSKEDGFMRSRNYSRVYTKGPLKDSDAYGFYDVDITASGRGYHYTLFYVHKNNLLFEVAVPGRLDYSGADPASANFDPVFLTIQDVVEDSALGMVDFWEAREK